MTFHSDAQFPHTQLSNRWYVIQCHPGRERIVHCAIKDEFTAFYPTRRRLISHAGRKSEVERPYYPLYTFVMFDHGRDSWGKILRMRGVNTVLGVRHSGGRPTPLPHGVVEKLMQISEISGGSIPAQGDEFHPMKRGELVRITEGPFEGFEGLVDADHKVRVRILLDILGKETPLSMPREALARVASVGS